MGTKTAYFRWSTRRPPALARSLKCCLSFVFSFSVLMVQKILCEDRFIAVDPEPPEKQLLSQILDAVRVTPTLHEDLQVEVMKVSVW